MKALWTVNDGQTRWSVWTEHIAKALDADLAEERIAEYPAPTPNAWALDLGCNTGRTYATLHQAGYQIIGMEPHYNDACASERYARRNQLAAWSVQGEVAHIPLPDRSVDLVIAIGVMYHLGVMELPSALAEIRRVLDYGGHALIHFLDINDWRRDLGHRANRMMLPTITADGNVTCFCTIDFIRKMIAQAGLKITRMDFVTRTDENGQRRNWIAHTQRGGFTAKG